jgi:hypothetical protein
MKARSAARVTAIIAHNAEEQGEKWGARAAARYLRNSGALRAEITSL